MPITWPYNPRCCCIPGEETPVHGEVRQDPGQGEAVEGQGQGVARPVARAVQRLHRQLPRDVRREQDRE